MFGMVQKKLYRDTLIRLVPVFILEMTNKSKGPRTKMLLVYVGAVWTLSCRCPVKAFHFYVVSALQFIVFILETHKQTNYKMVA